MYVLDAERMVEPHSGTITFLFTDVEGSTSLWERNPKAMSEALSRHDEILRTAIEAHNGHVLKTVGGASRISSGPSTSSRSLPQAFLPSSRPY